MTFKLWNIPSTFFWTSLIFLFYACSIAAGVIQDGLSQRAIFAMIPLPFLAIFVYSTFSTELDIVVDEVGISRVFKGKKLQSLTWNNIKYLKDFTMVTPNGQTRRFFQVFPLRSSKVDILRCGKITFSSRMYNFGTFVSLMNKYIKDNNIKIDLVNNGEHIFRNEISID